MPNSGSDPELGDSPVGARLRHRRGIAIGALLAADEVGVAADEVRELEREQLERNGAREQGFREAIRGHDDALDAGRQCCEGSLSADRDGRDADGSGGARGARQALVAPARL